MTSVLAAAFVNLLKTDATVGDICAHRIFPELAPDKTAAPYIVWLEVSSSSFESHESNDNLDATDVQFSCYATDKLTSLSLRSAVRAALMVSGAMTGVVATQPISRSLPQSEVHLYNSVLDVTFMHNPST